MKRRISWIRTRKLNAVGIDKTRILNVGRGLAPAAFYKDKFYKNLNNVNRPPFARRAVCMPILNRRLATFNKRVCCYGFARIGRHRYYNIINYKKVIFCHSAKSLKPWRVSAKTIVFASLVWNTAKLKTLASKFLTSWIINYKKKSFCLTIKTFKTLTGFSQKLAFLLFLFEKTSVFLENALRALSDKTSVIITYKK